MSDSIPPEYVAIVVQCWEGDPEKRPSFAQIVGRLNNPSATATSPNLARRRNSSSPLWKHHLKSYSLKSLEPKKKKIPSVKQPSRKLAHRAGSFDTLAQQHERVMDND